jgi:hypothetical protein
MVGQTISHDRILEKLGAGTADSSHIPAYSEVVPRKGPYSPQRSRASNLE